MPNDTTPTATAPPGEVEAKTPDYMENDTGYLVPKHMIRPELLLQDDLVRGLVARANRLREHIAAEKRAMFEDIRAFLDLLDEKYGVKRNGGRGGVTLDSFDGNSRVSISIADSITLGPALHAARALIDECIERWATGANANLRAIVDDAFKVGEGGKLAIDRVLALRRVDIDDDTWQRAMQAISDAIQVTSSREYLRLYHRPSREARLEQLAIDWSKL